MSARVKNLGAVVIIINTSLKIHVLLAIIMGRITEKKE